MSLAWLEKTLGRHGSQPKQVIMFWNKDRLGDQRACNWHWPIWMMNPIVGYVKVSEWLGAINKIKTTVFGVIRKPMAYSYT